MTYNTHHSIPSRNMAAMRDQELRESVHSAFEHYDADHSGAIDVKELTNLVADLGGFLTEKELKAALHALDKNGNGVIEKDEFTTWWMSQSSDLDGDAHVGELERALDRVRSNGQSRFRVDVHGAAWRGQVDVVERLIGEDPELANEIDRTEFGAGNTPLHYAAYQGHLGLCTYLLANGAKVNLGNAQGCTPLFLAAQQGRHEVVEIILEHGADMKISEKDHRWTPVDVAANDSIIKLFRARSGGVPCAPDPPSIIAASDTSITIQWNEPCPRHDQIAPTSGYKIKVATVSMPNTVQSLVVGPNPTQCLASSLDANTEYTVQVAAFNLHGIGPYSKPSSVTRTRLAKPRPPSQLRSRTIDAQSIELLWSGGSNNLEGDTYYVVQQCVDAVSDLWKNVGTAASSDARFVISDLLGNTKYQFRVAAVSKILGQSDFSQVHEARCLPDTTARRDGYSIHPAARHWDTVKSKMPGQSANENAKSKTYSVWGTTRSSSLGQDRELSEQNSKSSGIEEPHVPSRVADVQDHEANEDISEDEEYVFFEENTEQE